MEKFSNLPLIRQVFSFNVEMFKYCDDLIINRKKIFADKIINSSISGTLNIQIAFETDKKSVLVPALRKAEREFKNAVYWITLYEKASTYAAKAEFIEMGEEIHHCCKEELKKHL